MTSQQLHRNNAGSTLIEVLVAILIVGIVLTAIATALSFSIKNNAQAEYRQTASSIAQDAIELFRQQRGALGWTAFEASIAENATKCLSKGASTLSAMTSSCTGNYVNTSPPVTFNRTIKRNDTTDNTKRVSIIVTVSWTDGNSTRNVEIPYDFYNF